MPADTRSSGGAITLAQHIQTTSVALGRRWPILDGPAMGFGARRPERVRRCEQSRESRRGDCGCGHRSDDRVCKTPCLRFEEPQHDAMRTAWLCGETLEVAEGRTRDCARRHRAGRNPWFVADSPLEEGGFEPSVPLGKLVRSARSAAPRDLGRARKLVCRHSFTAGPEVQIRLPPAASQANSGVVMTRPTMAGHARRIAGTFQRAWV